MDQTVLNEIARLPSLPVPELKERWRELFGEEPKVTAKAHLVRRLAYRIQELRYGGLSDRAKVRLREIADADERGDGRMTRRKPPADRPVPGTRYIREWDGERHEVTVMGDGGYEYRGRPYKSLSAIARSITGTRWNGPAFFGLRERKRKGAR